MRTYGKLWYCEEFGPRWRMTCEPHVAMYAKRLFRRIPARGREYCLSATPAMARDLEWFTQRFPLAIDEGDRERLVTEARRHVAQIERLDRMIAPGYTPREFAMALPAREYQRRAADVFLAQGHLLLGDDVGLGKSCSAICALTEPETRPAIVVCLAHLTGQWQREIKKFLPGLTTHIVKQQAAYELPAVDVHILSYHKLANWCEPLGGIAKTVIFDECQELRRHVSQKYAAAKIIAEYCTNRIGLSATPIYNYGEEIWNVCNVLAPGRLGAREEFEREWCVGGKRIADPQAFGAWLKESHLMLRRTRRDVGRELPRLARITQPVDSFNAALHEVEDKARRLAELLLEGADLERGEAMNAAGQFDALLRQATGIDKAHSVAAFVAMLLESGEKVVLYGWHRAVYAIWKEKLARHNPLLYTGHESANQKERAVRAFIEGQSDLLIVSLRSGAGLDGLQSVCSTVVFGELDWSPGVHEQCIGRVHRDGQPDPVFAYFLVSDSGADPIMAEALGIKREQIEGIRGEGELVQRVDSTESLKALARRYLEK